jgi:3-oxoadipate enol-lactonase
MVGALSLHIEDTGGTRPAVVLLHGVPSSPDDFAPLVESLVPRHRVLVPHFPGYGRTPPDPAPYSLASVILRLERELFSRGVSRCAFVAFSGGAYKAVALAADARIQVMRLALVSPAIGFDPEVAAALREMAAAARVGAFDPRPSWLDRMASPGFAARHPVAAARILAWLDGVDPSVLCDELVAAADAPDLRPLFRNLACPVLVCTGTADRAVPPAASEALAASCRSATFVPIEGAGHASLIEAPTLIIPILGEFLDAP